MANKKAGNRAAAGQARARERARRKARSAGPSIPEAALAVPVADDEPAAGEPETASAESAAAEPAAVSRPAPQPPASVVAPVARRAARQVSALEPAGGLRRELAMIAAVTAVIGGALAFLKLATDIGA